MLVQDKVLAIITELWFSVRKGESEGHLVHYKILKDELFILWELKVYSSAVVFSLNKVADIRKADSEKISEAFKNIFEISDWSYDESSGIIKWYK